MNGFSNNILNIQKNWLGLAKQAGGTTSGSLAVQKIVESSGTERTSQN
jgi:hypothetical protein